jgi:hypothetical protein
MMDLLAAIEDLNKKKKNTKNIILAEILQGFFLASSSSRFNIVNSD